MLLIIYLLIAVTLGGITYGVIEIKDPNTAKDDDIMGPLVTGSALWPVAIIVIICAFVGKYLINVSIKIGHKIASKF